MKLQQSTEASSVDTHTALLFTDSDLTTGPTTPFECIFSSFVKLQQSTEASSVAFWSFQDRICNGCCTYAWTVTQSGELTEAVCICCRFWKSGYWSNHLGHRKYHIRWVTHSQVCTGDSQVMCIRYSLQTRVMLLCVCNGKHRPGAERWLLKRAKLPTLCLRYRGKVQMECKSKPIETRKCTLWRCKSTPTPKAKLLWMT